MTFYLLLFIFWSITYSLIIANNIKNKTIGFPLISIGMNFAWEIVATVFSFVNHYTNIQFVFIIWALLDVAVIVSTFIFCGFSIKRLLAFLITFILTTTALIFVFIYVPLGDAISCFAIDLLMAIDCLILISKKDFPKNDLIIVFYFTKLLGDLFAWIYALKSHLSILIMGILVLLLNITTLLIALVNVYQNKTKEKSH